MHRCCLCATFVGLAIRAADARLWSNLATQAASLARQGEETDRNWRVCSADLSHSPVCMYALSKSAPKRYQSQKKKSQSRTEITSAIARTEQRSKRANVRVLAKLRLSPSATASTVVAAGSRSTAAEPLPQATHCLMLSRALRALPSLVGKQCVGKYVLIHKDEPRFHAELPTTSIAVVHDGLRSSRYTGARGETRG
jgi:hypothetical protein